MPASPPTPLPLAPPLELSAAPASALPPPVFSAPAMLEAPALGTLLSPASPAVPPLASELSLVDPPQLMTTNRALGAKSNQENFLMLGEWETPPRFYGCPFFLFRGCPLIKFRIPAHRLLEPHAVAAGLRGVTR